MINKGHIDAKKAPTKMAMKKNLKHLISID
jgi:hypothetical protein